MAVKRGHFGGSAAPGATEEFGAELSRMFRRSIKEAIEQPFLLSLLIGSLLLSVASFFTTFAGMLHFMPVWFITFCIVFAVQALLFVTAWRIGRAVADKQALPIFTIFVFLVTFAVSVFFSWVALFESINDADLQERTRETRIHRAVEDTVSELHTRSLDARRDRVEELLASDVYAVWRDGVNQVADRANSARDVLEEQLRQRARDAAQRIAALEAERAGILRTEASVQERTQNAEREMTRLESERPALVEKVDRLRRERDEAQEAVVLAEGRMKAEETGGGEDRPAGRGPVWRELRDQRNILAAEAETRERLFEDARADLAAADSAIEEKKALIAANAAGGTAAPLAALDVEIERLKEAQLGSGADGGAVGLDAEVEKLRTNLADFATRLELEPFNAAAAQCATLLETMRSNADLAGRVAGLSCDRAAMAEFMNPIGVAVENIRALERECVVGGPNARNISDMNFADTVEYGRGCINFSGLPAAGISDLRGEIDRLVLEEDPKASQFVKTVNAFTGGEKLSYFALAIAVTIDVLVLFSGLIGAVSTRPKIAQHIRPQSDRQIEENVLRALSVDLTEQHDDPQDVRVAKIALRHVEPLATLRTISNGRRSSWQAASSIQPNDVKDPIMRDEVRGLLAKLVEAQMAVKESTNDGFSGAQDTSAFLIRSGVLDALRQQVVEHSERMAAISQRRRGGRRPGRQAVAALSSVSAPPLSQDGLSPRYRELDAAGAASKRQQIDSSVAEQDVATRGFAPRDTLRRSYPTAVDGDGAGGADLKAIKSEDDMTKADEELFKANTFNRVSKVR